jgi:hypothetical protein
MGAAYVLYAAVSHLVWSEVSPNGRGWPIGLAQAVALGLVARRCCGRTGVTAPIDGGATTPIPMRS